MLGNVREGKLFSCRLDDGKSDVLAYEPHCGSCPGGVSRLGFLPWGLFYLQQSFAHKPKSVASNVIPNLIRH